MTPGQIANKLLEIGAIKINQDEPFTWTSGHKSPVYCDNRLTLGHPPLRRLITSHFTTIIKDNFSKTDIICGVATAGIPQATLIANELGLPLIWTRSEAKGHGRKNKIEGEWSPSQKAIIIEDLISTGKSSIDSITTLQSVGIEVLAVLSIFNYGFESAAAKFVNLHIPQLSICDWKTLQQLDSRLPQLEDPNL